ncbi:hypothetical protein C8R45DRAFT_1045311, partial [Mycena sanguinolenta]
MCLGSASASEAADCLQFQNLCSPGRFRYEFRICSATREPTTAECIQFIDALLSENRAAALAALPDIGQHDADASDVSDASNASEIPLWPLPRFSPSVDLSDLENLAPHQAIAEIWVKYIPAAEVFVKSTRFWASENTPLDCSPTMILAINYLQDDRLDWSHWPLNTPCYKLTRLEKGAQTAIRALKLQCNFTRSTRLAEWATVVTE